MINKIKNLITRAPWAQNLFAFFIVIYILNLILEGRLVQLFSCNSHIKLLESYRLLTYFCLHDSVIRLIGNSLTIFLLALILEPRLPKKHYALVIICSVFIGGILFVFFSKNNETMIGAGMIKAALMGGVIACWFNFMSDFNKLETIYACVLLGCFISDCISSISYLFINTQVFSSMYISSWYVFFYGFAYIFGLCKYYPTKINRIITSGPSGNPAPPSS